MIPYPRGGRCVVSSSDVMALRSFLMMLNKLRRTTEGETHLVRSRGEYEVELMMARMAHKKVKLKHTV